jgi:hypothetical protein
MEVICFARNEGLDVKNASNRDMLRKKCQFEEIGSVVIGVIISVLYVGFGWNEL